MLEVPAAESCAWRGTEESPEGRGAMQGRCRRQGHGQGGQAELNVQAWGYLGTGLG